MINIGVSVKCFFCVDLLVIINLAIRHTSFHCKIKRSDGGTIHTPLLPHYNLFVARCLCLLQDEEKYSDMEISGVTFILFLVYQINCSKLQIPYIYISHILIESCKSTYRLLVIWTVPILMQALHTFR